MKVTFDSLWQFTYRKMAQEGPIAITNFILLVKANRKHILKDKTLGLWVRTDKLLNI